MHIRVGGRWHRAEATWTVHYGGGDAVVVRVEMYEDGWPMLYPRT
ncbi:hypothetical protein [Streptomyces sp. NBC_01433]|nr:hypothetical protein [Streptomyces sp. NBC_01433]